VAGDENEAASSQRVLVSGDSLFAAALPGEVRQHRRARAGRALAAAGGASFSDSSRRALVSPLMSRGGTKHHAVAGLRRSLGPG